MNNQVLAQLRVSANGIACLSLNASRDLGSQATTEAVDDQPYSFAYTGKHDGGQLPPNNVANSYGHVLSAVQELKDRFEAEMRRMIDETEGQRASDAERQAKRSRGDNEEEDGDADDS